MRGLIISILIISTINLSTCRNFLESGEKCQNELIADHCDNPSKSEPSHHLSTFNLGLPVGSSRAQSSQVVSIRVQSSPVKSNLLHSIPVESSWVQSSRAHYTTYLQNITNHLIQVLMGQVMSVTVKNITNVQIMDCGWCAVLPICISMRLCNSAKTQVIQVALKIQFASPVQPPV